MYFAVQGAFCNIEVCNNDLHTSIKQKVPWVANYTLYDYEDDNILIFICLMRKFTLHLTF